MLEIKIKCTLKSKWFLAFFDTEKLAGKILGAEYDSSASILVQVKSLSSG